MVTPTVPILTELRVPRTVSALGLIFERLDPLLADPRVDDRSAYVVRLAVEEIFTNMVKYNPEGEHTIAITASLDGASITVSMEDRGVRPFDVTAAETPGLNLPADERPVGGMGLHLVRSMVDGLEYRHDNGLTRIRITKALEH